MKKVYAAVLSIMIASLVSVSCGAGKSADAVISFYSGTATIQSANAQPRPVTVQDKVNDGDIIAYIHANDEEKGNKAIDGILANYEISDSVKDIPLIYDIVK